MPSARSVTCSRRRWRWSPLASPKRWLPPRSVYSPRSRRSSPITALPIRRAASSCATTHSWKSCRPFCIAMPDAVPRRARLAQARVRPQRRRPRPGADMSALTKGKRRLMGEINVVPYIDVMLVLLIIFMITAPLLTQGIKVELPKAAAEPIDAQAVNNIEPLVLSVDARGRLYLNVGADPKQPLDDATALARATAA